MGEVRSYDAESIDDAHRSSTSQCAMPVLTMKADGMLRSAAPFARSVVNNSGKRMS